MAARGQDHSRHVRWRCWSAPVCQDAHETVAGSGDVVRRCIFCRAQPLVRSQESSFRVTCVACRPCMQAGIATHAFWLRDGQTSFRHGPLVVTHSRSSQEAKPEITRTRWGGGEVRGRLRRTGPRRAIPMRPSIPTCSLAHVCRIRHDLNDPLPEQSQAVSQHVHRRVLPG